MYRKEESNVAVSECGDKDGNSSDAPQVQEEDLKQGPALSGNVEGLKLRLPEEAKALSKNALKALAKQERYKQAKQQRRAQEKEAQHQETVRKRREWQEKLASLTEEEVKEAYEKKLGVRALRKEELKGRKEKLQQAMQQGQNIVIDLDFGEKMKPNEISSLVQQVRTPPTFMQISTTCLWFLDLVSVSPFFIVAGDVLLCCEWESESTVPDIINRMHWRHQKASGKALWIQQLAAA